MAMLFSIYMAVQIGIIGFGGLVVMGMIVYSCVTLLFDKFADYGMYRLIRERIGGWDRE